MVASKEENNCGGGWASILVSCGKQLMFFKKCKAKTVPLT
jgi:hypothetical protein